MCGKKTRLIDAEALKLSHCKECSLYPDKCMGKDCDWHAIIHINEMPTIDTEPHWIPCSKKLPEYFEPVITWDGHCYFVEKRIPYIRDEDGNPIKGEWWVSDDYDEEETDYYPNLRDGAAITWMPLPKPYEVKE